MTDRAQSRLKSISLVIGIIVGTITILGASAGYFNNRIDSTNIRVDRVESQLLQHKENTSIHRTSEEARAVERGDTEFREFVKSRLISIEHRIENLERRR